MGRTSWQTPSRFCFISKMNFASHHEPALPGRISRFCARTFAFRSAQFSTWPPVAGHGPVSCRHDPVDPASSEARDVAPGRHASATARDGLSAGRDFRENPDPLAEACPPPPLSPCVLSVPGAGRQERPPCYHSGYGKRVSQHRPTRARSNALGGQQHLDLPRRCVQRAAL